MKFVAPALFLLMATMAGATPAAETDWQSVNSNRPLSAQSLTLAWRLMSDEGGTEAIVRGAMQAVLGRPDFITSPPLFFKAYQDALDHHREDIIRCNALLAKTYAQVLSQQQMSNEIAFLESPLGRSIRAKQAASIVSVFTGHFVPVTLTPKEQSADVAFALKNENGQTQRIKYILQKLRISTLMRKELEPLLTSISHEAMETYCRDGGDCSKIHMLATAPATK